MARDEAFDAKSLLRSLMENIPGAIYRSVNDKTWRVLTVSDEIEAITGYPAAELVDGSKLVAATHPDDRDPVMEQIDAGRPWVLEYRVVRADGDIRWVHERGVKTVDRDGTEWIDGIIFDVTERRAAEQLRVAELEARIGKALPRKRPVRWRLNGRIEGRPGTGASAAAPGRLAVNGRIAGGSERATERVNVGTARSTRRLPTLGIYDDVNVGTPRSAAPTRRADRACAGSRTGSGAVGGTLHLVSPPEGGTRLRARVPL